MERELDEIKVTYLAAHEAGEAPSLDELVARHPQHRDELVEFVMAALELDSALDGNPEPQEPSATTRRLREEAVRGAWGVPTLRGALAGAGISREQVAAAARVPVSFVVRVERGRLVPDGEDPVDPRFVARLAELLHRTAEEALDILRATFRHPPARSRAGHARGSGQLRAEKRPVAESFRALLAGCADLTPEQRREWLDDQPDGY